ncbi:hypothetical protein LAU42_08910 [Macrococcus armenti]|uniref:hypothetical protein n=1 Tax=Macrococcus armenti TaxID=2875764 RepID=UPI001CC98685|nr:hypothetical protein [Macrococcus armenti]UBH21886.1 hypothetical protein LAU42_08910 [Macrococcus armenti]
MNEIIDQEAILEYINELLNDQKRMIVGISTKAYDGDDDISKIIINVAPRDNDV